MVVVENVHRLIIGIPRATDARVAWTEGASLDVIGQRRCREERTLAQPGPVLPMRGHDDPFLAERMPPLFPCWRAGRLHRRLIVYQLESDPTISLPVHR